MRIIGISGSNRINSYNTGLITKGKQLMPPGIDFEILDISRWPIYNQDLESSNIPAEIVIAKEIVKGADGVVISTPEHNYSVPALLKNAIDWMSRPPQRSFDRKPVLIVGASPGAYGTVRAQSHLRDIMHAINADVFSQPQLLVNGVKSKVDEFGVLTDEKTIEVYQSLLVKWLATIPQSTTALLSE